MQDSGGGPDVAVAIHPNFQDRVVLLQQDNRVAIETFEEVRRWAVCGAGLSRAVERWAPVQQRNTLLASALKQGLLPLPCSTPRSPYPLPL